MQGKEERPKKCTTSIKTYKFNSAHLIVVKLMVNGGLPKNKKNNFERSYRIVATRVASYGDGALLILWELGMKPKLGVMRGGSTACYVR